MAVPAQLRPCPASYALYSCMQLGEDQPTSPHDLALILLDEPVPERFPIVQLPTGE